MNIIFKAKVGSHAYGTNIEGSDEDFKMVYLQTPESVLEHGYREQVDISKDETAYELRRFIELCCTGNPTMLELLYSPEDCIEFIHPVFERILEHRDRFLSKSCRWSFGGYAISQIGRAQGLEKKMNWEKEKTIRKTVLDFCYVIDTNSKFKSLPVKEWLKGEQKQQQFCGLSAIDHFRYTYMLFYDHLADMKNSNPRFDGKSYGFKGIVQDEETSNDISLSDIPKYATRDTILYFNKDDYSRHCKDYKSYQEWLEKRNTQRYVDIKEHGQRIDGKNLLHCLRLLEVGIEVARDKTIHVRRPNAKYLVSIRKGEVDLNKILEEAQSKLNDLDLEYQKSDLPDKVDRGYWLALLPKIRKEFYAKESTL